MRVLAGIFILFLLASCASGAGSGESGRVYDSQEYCFNGVSVVTLDGRCGLADTCGREILPPAYDEVTFLTDEVAAAVSGRLCIFVDRSGRRLAETVLPVNASAESLSETYEAAARETASKWDSVIYEYSALRRYCSSPGASADSARAMAGRIRAMLPATGGPMTALQRSLFETEFNEYEGL